MKKRLLSTLLAPVLCLTLLPAPAAAADGDLKILGIPVTDANKDDVLGDGLVRYDPDTNTVTLEPGAAPVSSQEDGILYTGMDTLTVVGSGARIDVRSRGIAAAELVIEPTAVLGTVSAGSVGLLGYDTVNIQAPVTVRGDYYSVYANTGITLADGLTANGEIYYQEPQDFWVFVKDNAILTEVIVTGKVPSAGGPAANPMFWPQLPQSEDCAVRSIPLAVSEGGTMELVVQPAPGKVLDGLTVTDWEGAVIPVEKIGENRWRFVQPDSTVTVTPVFRDGAATRADLALLLWEQAGKPVVNYILPFADVDQEAPYAEAVRWAAAEKLILGHADGTFRPAELLTREQAAAALYRQVQKAGGGFRGMWMYLLPCDDRAEIGEWAYEAVCWMTKEGVMEITEGRFDPRGTVTLAELSAMIR